MQQATAPGKRRSGGGGVGVDTAGDPPTRGLPRWPIRAAVLRGGDPGIFAAAAAAGSASGCAVRPGRSTNPRYLALLRVDVAALRRGRVAGEELCEIAGVGPVPVSVRPGAAR